jgi:hypothetical protein
MKHRVTIHEVKCERQYWLAVEAGEKPFEVRNDDRGYQRGDWLKLICTRDGMYSMKDRLPNGDAKFLMREITYVLTGGRYGIDPGYVVLGLAEITEQQP